MSFHLNNMNEEIFWPAFKLFQFINESRTRLFQFFNCYLSKLAEEESPDSSNKKEAEEAIFEEKIEQEKGVYNFFNE